MASKSKRLLLGTLAVLVAVVALESVYLLGYRQGSQDALDWSYTAVVDGKVVPLGKRTALLRSRVDVRPNYSVNSAPAIVVSPKGKL
ncbi:MAG TPA: hypothetical protein VEC99_06115 [Clostridia bacterium]|nr:hypothetical protein [Clostridia bacterium]